MGKTTEEFIEEAREVHGDLYDYSQVDYVNSGTKVTIICTKHGEFEQRPASHLQGYGCPECGREKAAKTRAKNKQIIRAKSKTIVRNRVTFIDKARSVHGDRYKYSKVKYENSQKEVTIICPIHGEFEQKPIYHTQGNGCPKCGKHSFSREEIIKKCQEVHGNKYRYDKVPTHPSSYLTITCPRHGDFEQRKDCHLAGQGCPECGIEGIKERLYYTQEEILERFREIHGDKYDYSPVRYVNTSTKVKILCPKHGIFEQYPRSHLSGYGCYKCGREQTTVTTEEFLERAREVHGDKYDYSKANCRGYSKNIRIICPIHGEFEQIAGRHLAGNGCPRCGWEVRSLTTEEFIEEAREVHGDKYGYDKVEYKSATSPVTIVCPVHGEFEQRPNQHLYGKGCRKCGNLAVAASQTSTTEEFIRKAKRVHGNQYKYSKVDYKRSSLLVKIICPKHGVFEQTPDNHIQGHGCPRCVTPPIISNPHKKVIGFLKKLKIPYENNARIFAENRYEMDIYIPSLKIGIEINGDYWHSLERKGKNYHQMKADLAEAQGITLLQFWGSEIYNKWPLVKSMIRAKVGKIEKRMYARQLEIAVIPASEARKFLEGHHMQTSVGATVRLGLQDGEGHLMALMTFGKPRFNKDFEWELLRYCSRRNWAVVGGFSRLLKAFERGHNPESLISYANRRWSVGNVYKQNGFQKRKWNSKPSYVYSNNSGIVSRYQAQRHNLPKLLGEQFDPNLSERDNMLKAKYWVLYDAGNLVFRKLYPDNGG